MWYFVLLLCTHDGLHFVTHAKNVLDKLFFFFGVEHPSNFTYQTLSKTKYTFRKFFEKGFIVHFHE